VPRGDPAGHHPGQRHGYQPVQGASGPEPRTINDTLTFSQVELDEGGQTGGWNVAQNVPL